ncbi:hypothetical protein B0H11DRAFT_1899394 [Mycena galericulata]|nr:hypothetical protein B0H11DRAFT_1899394 [Mycena galericulata]
MDLQDNGTLQRHPDRLVNHAHERVETAHGSQGDVLPMRDFAARARIYRKNGPHIAEKKMSDSFCNPARVDTRTGVDVYYGYAQPLPPKRREILICEYGPEAQVRHIQRRAARPVVPESEILEFATSTACGDGCPSESHETACWAIDTYSELLGVILVILCARGPAVPGRGAGGGTKKGITARESYDASRGEEVTDRTMKRTREKKKGCHKTCLHASIPSFTFNQAPWKQPPPQRPSPSPLPLRRWCVVWPPTQVRKRQLQQAPNSHSRPPPPSPLPLHVRRVEMGADELPPPPANERPHHVPTRIPDAITPRVRLYTRVVPPPFYRHPRLRLRWREFILHIRYFDGATTLLPRVHARLRLCTDLHIPPFGLRLPLRPPPPRDPVPIPTSTLLLPPRGISILIPIPAHVSLVRLYRGYSAADAEAATEPLVDEAALPPPKSPATTLTYVYAARADASNTTDSARLLPDRSLYNGVVV